MEQETLQEGTILYNLGDGRELEEGIFLERPNRFVATVEVGGELLRVHVADTGRLEEILTPGRRLLLQKNRPGMKTHATLLAARMEEGWVLINTRLHAPIARRAIELGILGFVPHQIRNEVSFGGSRIDYLADTTLVELKGCSLVREGLCLFPNAPSIRATRHLGELMAARASGYEAAVLILALRRCRCFRPYGERDPRFAEAFEQAMEAGVAYRGFFVRLDDDLNVRYDGKLSLCGE
ncbi:DNA/RNA nuclease SfsA [Nitratifractor sp.]